MACRILGHVMPSLPTGTVTFLFSDIEGSTTLLKRLGDAAYAQVLATHRQLMRETFAGFGGQEIDTQGDAFFYSFPRARDAVAAAVEVQRAHAKAGWPNEVDVRLRIGLHTGEPAVGDEGYTGLDVVRASRISALGRGGQVLLSDTTRAIVAADLPEGVELRPVGDRQLRDIDRPEPLSELIITGVPVTPAAAEIAGPAAAGDPPPSWPFDGEDDLPSWMTGAARRFMPATDRTRDLIEERVMGAIARAFDAKRHGPGRGGGGPGPVPPAPPAPPAPPGRSVADEIGRLRDLRDAGALTDEQYARAVDRAVGGDTSAAE